MRYGMRSIVMTSLVIGVLLAGTPDGLSQAASSDLQKTGPQQTGPKKAGPQNAASAADGPGGVPATVVDSRSDKQKALALQAEQLFAMATELKAQVDKTNRNILSLKVVEKAEQIELTAKGLKGAAKK